MSKRRTEGWSRAKLFFVSFFSFFISGCKGQQCSKYQFNISDLFLFIYPQFFFFVFFFTFCVGIYMNIYLAMFFLTTILHS